MTERSPKQTISSTWRNVSSAWVLWLVGGVLLGCIPAAAFQGHGSAIFVWFGAFAGISGAIAHTCLLCIPVFRSMKRAAQVLTAWIITLLLFLTIGMLTSFSSLGAALKFTSLFIAAPTLAATVLFVHLLSRRAAS